MQSTEFGSIREQQISPATLWSSSGINGNVLHKQNYTLHRVRRHDNENAKQKNL